MVDRSELSKALRLASEAANDALEELKRSREREAFKNGPSASPELARRLPAYTNPGTGATPARPTPAAPTAPTPAAEDLYPLPNPFKNGADQ